ncbi:MAG: LPS assembly lipoprotein LptE, partial [Planctomycetota bacterium]
VVANATFERGDSEQLTGALVNRIEARTPYRVADVSQADTLLEVTITDANRRTVSRGRATGLPDQQLYVVTADFTWTDLRTGETLVRRENVEQVAEVYPTLGEGQFFASQAAAEALATGIVEALGSTW